LPGDQQLKYLVSVFHRNSLLGKICLMGALTPEYATFDDYMQLTVQALCLSILGWVTELLENGRSKGKLRFKGDPSVRAQMVVSTLLSGLLLNRVLDDEGVFGTIADGLLEDLGVEWRIADLPEPGRGSPGTYSHSYT
jgi:hypothetical protein